MLAHICAETRDRHFERCGSLSGFASEILAVMFPLCFMLETQGPIRVTFPLELDSFIKLTYVVQLMSRAKQGDTLEAAIDAAMLTHGEAFTLAYGSQAKNPYKPKFHYGRKLGRQLRRDGMWLDCWTLERKHSLMKEAASNLKNTSRYEYSTLALALQLHKRSLDDACIRDGLVTGAAEMDSPKLAAAMGSDSCSLSRQMRWGGTVFAMDDIVFFQGRPFQILSCACNAFAMRFQLGFVVRELELVHQVYVCRKPGGRLK